MLVPPEVPVLAQHASTVVVPMQSVKLVRPLRIVIELMSICVRSDAKRSTTYEPKNHLDADAMLSGVCALMMPLPVLPETSAPFASPISQ